MREREIKLIRLMYRRLGASVETVRPLGRANESAMGNMSLINATSNERKKDLIKSERIFRKRNECTKTLLDREFDRQESQTH